MQQLLALAHERTLDLVALSQRGHLALSGDDPSVRNIMTIGALRVDDDIGLAVLLANLRI
jgi:hypothetical protein